MPTARLHQFGIADLQREGQVSMNGGGIIGTGDLTSAGMNYDYGTVGINLTGTSGDPGTLSITRVVVKALALKKKVARLGFEPRTK